MRPPAFGGGCPNTELGGQPPQKPCNSAISEDLGQSMRAFSRAFGKQLAS
jgi:hypothetical protein